ncbi:Importin beta domain containing protein [Acanthamoeba castellanii str. Neff]|uniref:Importin beta domain containing protein n=1 Tax=Acanthamoeba castellanii (strain ATCC 30010 / Neff) TaxID=1257118 RepID=L8H9T2_ACACF|nr:Importin beta domain containing protein [Acanthamoeba castellanii str. Neff]ELR21483.1 Importin beta domain containing protein [Acanthamoeba castellanii str. Neff]
MAEELMFKCLSALLLPDQSIRQAAEQQLNELSSQSGFGVTLARLSLSSGCPLPIRQLAGVVLKGYINAHWDSADVKFVEPQTTPQDKAAIRAILPQGLADPESKIRTASAMAIASIAHWDWPGEWPNLIEELSNVPTFTHVPRVKCLDMNNAQLMDGAIKCLEMFASGDNLSDEHLPRLIPLLFPHLLRIFSSDYPERIRARAGSIFYSCLEWLSVIKSVHAESTEAFRPFLPQWTAHFAEILAAPLTSPDADYGLKIVVLQILTILVMRFPKQLGPFLNGIVPQVWNSLVSALAIYEEFVVEGDGIEAAQDEEGEMRGLEMLIMLLLDFVQCLLSKKAFAQVFATSLPSLCALLISYMQITQNQLETWTDDPNEYVADEDDEIRFNARASCTHLLREIAQQFGQAATQAIALGVGKRLQESVKQQQSGNRSWWKLREASVLAVGSTAEVLINAPQGFDHHQFMAAILQPDLQTTASPFLRGRALWCASQFSHAVAADKSLPFIQAAVASLQSQQDPLPVKICACRALASYCPKLEDKGVIGQMVPPTVQGLAVLLGQTSEETLHLTLETLLVVLSTAGEAVRPFVEGLTQQLIRVWGQCINDPLITADIQDCLRVLAKIPDCAAMLKAALLPYLIQLISPAPEGKDEVIYGAREVSVRHAGPASVQLLTMLVHATPDMQPSDPLLTKAFPVLVQQLITTADNSLLNEGCACLSAYVSRAPGLLLQWNDGRSNGIGYILQFVGRLLQPSTSDMAALYVGPLVTKIISKFKTVKAFQLMDLHTDPHLQLGGQLGAGTLTDMLKAVLARLQTQCMPSLAQSLVLIFARLMMGGIVPGIGSPAQTKEIRDFLSSIQVAENTTALTFVFQTWAKQQDDFHGTLNIKASILGLLNLFCLQDQQLLSMPVEGDIIVQRDQGRSSRSKAKAGQTPVQRQTVPLAVKALKAAVQELMVMAEQKEGGGEDDGSDDSDVDEYQDDMKALMAEMGADPSTGGWLMDQLLDDHLDEEEEEDPDCVNDPLYQLDLKAFLEGFLKNFATQNREAFGMVANMLPSLEQRFLIDLLKRLASTSS